MVDSRTEKPYTRFLLAPKTSHLLKIHHMYQGKSIGSFCIQIPNLCPRAIVVANVAKFVDSPNMVATSDTVGLGPMF